LFSSPWFITRFTDSFTARFYTFSCTPPFCRVLATAFGTRLPRLCYLTQRTVYFYCTPLSHVLTAHCVCTAFSVAVCWHGGSRVAVFARDALHAAHARRLRLFSSAAPRHATPRLVAMCVRIKFVFVRRFAFIRLLLDFLPLTFASRTPAVAISCRSLSFTYGSVGHVCGFTFVAFYRAVDSLRSSLRYATDRTLVHLVPTVAFIADTRSLRHTVTVLHFVLRTFCAHTSLVVISSFTYAFSHAFALLLRLPVGPHAALVAHFRFLQNWFRLRRVCVASRLVHAHKFHARAVPGWFTCLDIRFVAESLGSVFTAVKHRLWHSGYNHSAFGSGSACSLRLAVLFTSRVRNISIIRSHITPRRCARLFISRATRARLPLRSVYARHGTCRSSRVCLRSTRVLPHVSLTRLGCHLLHHHAFPHLGSRTFYRTFYARSLPSDLRLRFPFLYRFDRNTALLTTRQLHLPRCRTSLALAVTGITFVHGSRFRFRFLIASFSRAPAALRLPRFIVTRCHGFAFFGSASLLHFARTRGFALG